MAVAARETGANDTRIQFVRLHGETISRLLDTCGAALPPEMIKNKILRNFLDGLRDRYDDALIDRAQTLLHAVKVQVKAEFPLQYFYRTKENVTHGGIRPF